MSVDEVMKELKRQKEKRELINELYKIEGIKDACSELRSKTIEPILKEIDENIGKLFIERGGIYCGDAIKLMKYIPDKSIDLILTDPPYGIDYATHSRKKKMISTAKGIKSDKSHITFPLLREFAKEAFRVLKDNRHLYMFTRWDVLCPTMRIVEKFFDIQCVLIWDKGERRGMGDLRFYGLTYEMIIFALKGDKRGVLGGKRPKSVIKCKPIPSGKLVHVHQKPVKLLVQLIKNSTREGEIVLDPFIGSGMTYIACIRTNRRCLGFELDKKVFEIAMEQVKKERSVDKLKGEIPIDVYKRQKSKKKIGLEKWL